MCGIAGIFFKGNVSPEVLDSYSAHFASNLHHRGPDAFGAHRGERSVFANLRLAIVDRSGGDQPIYAPGRRQGIVYNGEVYNWQTLRKPLEEKGYPFTTHTDTESVLAAFLARGESALADLNGMFALCIWDEEKGTFTLARDRFGSKPLYLYEDDQRFAFASEIKTLLGLPGVDDSLNPLAFQDFLTYRYPLAPHTFFKRIEKLPAGCALHFDGKSRSIRRYAELSLQEPQTQRAPEEYIEELDGIMERAVHSQLMGEVPIGVLLSGGLDSSAIACYVQRAGARLKAYNIGFPEVNEFAYSREVAQKFGLQYEEICMTKEELVAGMDATMLRLDEPIADPACFALSRLCESIKKDVTVVLSGEGSDEMFAGYGQHLFALDPRLDRELCFTQFFHYSANFADARSWLRDKNLPFEQFRYKGSAYDGADTALNGMQNFELRTWLPENLMMKADKVLMAHSLEGRFPFLDLELLRFASTLPQKMKLPSPESTKHVLRMLMADKLPESVITRRKMGFTVPPAFFLQRLRGRFELALELLRKQPVAEVLDLDAMTRLMQGYYAGEQIPVFKIWNIFVLLFWFAYVYPLFKSGRSLETIRPGEQLDLSTAVPVQAERPKDADAPAAAPAAAAVPAAGEPESGRLRLAVYTVLLGDKEQLGNPLRSLSSARTDLDIDFVCFTDNRALTSKLWRFEYLEPGHLPVEKLSRRPKALPHEYLPGYDYSLYIDNTVDLKRLPESRDLASARPYLFKAFRHATRTTLWEEADVIASIGYDEVKTICGQLDFYRSLKPLEGIAPLSTCTVLLRAHHHPKIVQFGVTWWEQILNFSKRDQMSFDFSLQHAGCEVEYFAGTTSENDMLRWPSIFGSSRVLANFDATRYAWKNRQDPAAVANPKRHFLARGGAEGSFSQPVPLFEYICHKQKSSLGSLVSPRRSVALPLGDLLARYRELSGNLLLVRVRDDEAPLAFLDEEFPPAASALAMMLHKCKAQLLETSAKDLRQPSIVYQGSALLFDAVVVLGLPADCLPLFLEKFGRIINPERGMIALICSGEGDLAAIQRMRDQLSAPRLGMKAQASVSFSRHDDLDSPLSNSCVWLEWGDSQKP